MLNIESFLYKILSLKEEKYSRSSYIDFKKLSNDDLEYFEHIKQLFGIKSKNYYQIIKFLEIFKEYNVLDIENYSLNNCIKFLNDYYDKKLQILKIPLSIHNFLKQKANEIYLPNSFCSNKIYRLFKCLIENSQCEINSDLDFHDKYFNYLNNEYSIFLYKYKSQNKKYKETSLNKFYNFIHKQIEKQNEEQNKLNIKIDDEYVFNYFEHFLNNRKNINIKCIDKNIISYLSSKYNHLTNNVIEQIYLFINKLDSIPKCKICGQKCNFFNLKRGYSKTCKNKKCSAKVCQEKRENTLMSKYGIKCNFLRDDICEKQKQAMIDKYGVDNIFKTKDGQLKCKETLIKKYNGVGCSSKIIREKIRNTNLKKYGWEHNWQDPEEQKRSHSLEAKEKMKKTCLERYGVEYSGQAKQKIEKTKETNYLKYGVSNPMKLPEFVNKVYISMKKNGTLNTSKSEDFAFSILNENFSNVIRHYKDKERYPFVCDFYIPSLDLFIEYQGSMFHNKRPYLGTEEDLKEVEEIKQKSEKRKQITGKTKSRYDSLIETWTVRDPLKRETAKKNNLNYLEFFTIIELQNWLNTFNKYEGDK